ncbi:MAG: hypothetical protein EZS28_007719 [Streblomastix strix]|uniref:Uncharacterized protein n=1 Tax=Streblomastix strix TaxID=222440 RepID=A0A5J4WQP3_9EUKA|nr:MAG: hypothetical protein EZS28_007719 [Streblomastix strix]
MSLLIPQQRSFAFFAPPRLRAIYNRSGQVIPFDGVTCMVGHRGLLFCGCQDGTVLIIQKDGGELIGTSRKLHDKPILFLTIAKAREMLLTFAEDKISHNICVFFWTIQQLFLHNLNPTEKLPTLTAVACSPSATQVALGFNTGETVLVSPENSKKNKRDYVQILAADGLAPGNVPRGWIQDHGNEGTGGSMVLNITPQSTPQPAVTALFFAEDKNFALNQPEQTKNTKNAPITLQSSIKEVPLALFIANHVCVRAIPTTNPFPHKRPWPSVVDRDGMIQPDQGWGNQQGSDFIVAGRQGIRTLMFQFQGLDQDLGMKRIKVALIQIVLNLPVNNKATTKMMNNPDNHRKIQITHKTSLLAKLSLYKMIF